MGERHFLVVADDDIYIEHPNCPEIPHHWSTPYHPITTVDCPYEEQVEAIGLVESLADEFESWPPANGRYEIEFWSEKWYVPWRGYEYDYGLRLVIEVPE